MGILGRFKNYATTVGDMARGKVSGRDAYRVAKATPGGVYGKRRGGTKKHKSKSNKTEVLGAFTGPKRSEINLGGNASSTSKSGGQKYGSRRSSGVETSGKSHGSSGAKKLLKKQAKTAKARREHMKQAYENLYSTLRGNLLAQRDSTGKEHTLALQGLEQDYTNAKDRSGRAREETNRFYDDKEDTLKNQYKDQRKERERIFQARNITNSSYYIDAVTKADTEFNKTLGRLNEDEARTVAEQDTQLKELEQTKLQNRAKIESAYASAMRQIQNNVAKSDFEKENAMQGLQDEYDNKMYQINNSLLQIKAQQQDFRDKVSKYAVSKKYQDNDYNYNINNKALKRKDLGLSEKIKQAMMAGKLNKKDDEDNRFVSKERQTPSNQKAVANLTALWLNNKK